IRTQAGGQTQILFLDQSSLTIAPRSDLILDEFVYDPKAGTGKLALSMGKGLLRYVGGAISKQQGGVKVDTPVASLTIRGGIAYSWCKDDGCKYLYGYGENLTICPPSGKCEVIDTPGIIAFLNSKG